MIPKNKFPTYNDGVLFVCENTAGRSDFSSAKNARSRKDLRRILKLDYKEMSRRDEDMDFAESHGRTLTLKVRCRYHPDVSTKLCVVIGDTLYSIFKTDHDTDWRNLYLFLEEERKL